jgi:hypothetical protein
LRIPGGLIASGPGGFFRTVVDEEAARGQGHRRHFFAFRGKSSAYLTGAIDVEHADLQVGRTDGPGTCARAWRPPRSSKVRRLTMVGRMAHSHASE